MSFLKLAVLNYSDFSIQHNLINLDRLEDRTIKLRIESLRSYPYIVNDIICLGLRYFGKYYNGF